VSVLGHSGLPNKLLDAFLETRVEYRTGMEEDCNRESVTSRRNHRRLGPVRTSQFHHGFPYCPTPQWCVCLARPGSFSRLGFFHGVVEEISR